MEIYVQSAGVAPEEDYSWLNEGNQVIAYPPLVEKYKDLLQTESPSILLARDEGKLLLFVTGIRTKRKDYQSRTIAISVAWVGKNSDEALLRYQASRILKSFINQDSLNKDIDAGVKAGGPKGFSVAFDKLKLSKKAQQGPKIQAGITRKSDDGIKALAEELEKYSLPDKKGPLVVITGIQTEADLKKAGVYRALANFPAEMVPVVPVSSKKSNLLAIGAAIAAVLLIVIGVTFNNLLSTPKPPESSTKIAALPTPTSQNSEKKDDSFKKERPPSSLDKLPTNQLVKTEASYAGLSPITNIEKPSQPATDKKPQTTPNQSTETTGKSEQQKAEEQLKSATTTSEKPTPTTNQPTKTTAHSKPETTAEKPSVPATDKKPQTTPNQSTKTTANSEPKPTGEKPSVPATDKKPQTTPTQSTKTTANSEQQKVETSPSLKQEYRVNNPIIITGSYTPNLENQTWELKLGKGLLKAGDYSLIFKVTDSNGKPIIVDQKLEISVKEPAPEIKPQPATSAPSNQL
ncbi:hypothetical protein NG798_23945 [Ancylothrix sp. C2]|uniref:hypothetical protein n=1 Tax=Ancylothrix sp. D3o TaxID=2953691 RepID=UPI0021BA8A71|nr:hypothetical protein [Ancylothrix sp. D3o]MCT7952856.1 hypothetical protein [Ancylothrix sp. D3o]